MTESVKPRLAAILLAAGESNRLGQPKQLVSLNGVSLVRRAAGLLLDLNMEPLLVVTGYRSDEVAAELHGLSPVLVHNDDWAAGMGGSIACGAKEIPETVDGILLVLCDQWMLRETDFQSVVNIWKSDISRIVVSGWENEQGFVSGPPVIFPRRLLPGLTCLKGKEGAKAIIDHRRDSVCRIAVPNAAFDLDSPQDLVILKSTEVAL